MLAIFVLHFNQIDYELSLPLFSFLFFKTQKTKIEPRVSCESRAARAQYSCRTCHASSRAMSLRSFFFGTVAVKEDLFHLKAVRDTSATNCINFDVKQDCFFFFQFYWPRFNTLKFTSTLRSLYYLTENRIESLGTCKSGEATL